MARVPPARRADVPPHLQPAYDAAVRHHAPTGNHAVLLYSPEACVRGHHFVDYLRGDTSCLPARLRQLAMLVVAREHDCQFIWAAHAPKARTAGVSAALVEALRDRKPLPPMPSDEATVIRYGQAYYRTRRVNQEMYEEVRACLGVQGVAELTMLMGFYAMLAFNVAAFEIEILPHERGEPLLPV
jgi:4-carboxymuconolactone decarboxylase